MRHSLIALSLASVFSSVAFAGVQPIEEVIKQNVTPEHKMAVIVRPEKLLASPLVQQILPPSVQAAFGDYQWQTIVFVTDYDQEKRTRHTFESIAEQLDSSLAEDDETEANKPPPEIDDATLVIARCLKPIAEKEVLQSILAETSREFGSFGPNGDSGKLKFEAFQVGGKTAHRISIVYEWSYEIKGKAKVGRSDQASDVGYSTQLDSKTVLICKTRKQLESSLKQSSPTELSQKLEKMLGSDSAQLLVLADDVQSNSMLKQAGLPAPSVKHVRSAIARLDVEGQRTLQLELDTAEEQQAATLANELNALWRTGQEFLENAPSPYGATEEDKWVADRAKQAVLGLEIKAQGSTVVSYLPRPDKFDELVTRLQKSIDRQVRPTQQTSIQSQAKFKDISEALELEEAGTN